MLVLVASKNCVRANGSAYTTQNCGVRFADSQVQRGRGRGLGLREREGRLARAHTNAHIHIYIYIYTHTHIHTHRAGDEKTKLRG